LTIAVVVNWLAISKNNHAATIRIADVCCGAVCLSSELESGQEIGLWTLNVLPVQVRDGSIRSKIPTSCLVYTAHSYAIHSICQLLDFSFQFADFPVEVTAVKLDQVVAKIILVCRKRCSKGTGQKAKSQHEEEGKHFLAVASKVNWSIINREDFCSKILAFLKTPTKA